MSTLIFITCSYPYRRFTEPSFIRPEVEALCSEFDRVIFVPVMETDEADTLPANAIVYRELTGRLPLWRRIAGMASINVWKNVFADRRHIHSLKDLRGSIATSVYVKYYRGKLLKLIADMNIEPTDTLIYNFWFTASALASTMIDGVRSLSRAHGHDIYPEQGVYLSHSLRDRALEKLLKVYVASEAGANYMRECYPDKAEKIITAHLGSRDPEGLNPNKMDGDDEISLLCVARTEPVKRVPMMYNLLKAWAESRPDLKIRWIYIGNGSEMPTVKELVTKESVPNLTVELLGAKNNHEVHHIMSTRHIDAMLLTSSSEGGAPIALNEALSYGLPSIATAVGGVPEIVSQEVGALLTPYPTADEFISVMNHELPLLPTKRQAAREKWENGFRASNLRQKFATELRNYL